MNCNDLYEGKYKNGNPTYYVDKGCTIPFTGHLEEYFKGKLSRECDIVNGIMEEKYIMILKAVWKCITK